MNTHRRSRWYHGRCNCYYPDSQRSCPIHPPHCTSVVVWSWTTSTQPSSGCIRGNSHPRLYPSGSRIHKRCRPNSCVDRRRRSSMQSLRYNSPDLRQDTRYSSRRRPDRRGIRFQVHTRAPQPSFCDPRRSAPGYQHCSAFRRRHRPRNDPGLRLPRRHSGLHRDRTEPNLRTAHPMHNAAIRRLPCTKTHSQHIRRIRVAQRPSPPRHQVDCSGQTRYGSKAVRASLHFFDRAVGTTVLGQCAATSRFTARNRLRDGIERTQPKRRTGRRSSLPHWSLFVHHTTLRLGAVAPHFHVGTLGRAVAGSNVAQCSGCTVSDRVPATQVLTTAEQALALAYHQARRRTARRGAPPVYGVAQTRAVTHVTQLPVDRIECTLFELLAIATKQPETPQPRDSAAPLGLHRPGTDSR